MVKLCLDQADQYQGQNGTQWFVKLWYGMYTYFTGHQRPLPVILTNHSHILELPYRPLRWLVVHTTALRPTMLQWYYIYCLYLWFKWPFTCPTRSVKRPENNLQNCINNLQNCTSANATDHKNRTDDCIIIIIILIIITRLITNVNSFTKWRIVTALLLPM